MSLVNLTETGTQLTICAKADGVAKIMFFFDGILVRTDGSRPYCLENDYKTVYEPASFVGYHNITAIALDANNLPLDDPYSAMYEVAPVPVTNFRLLDVTRPLPEIEILSNSSVVSRQNHGLSLTICAVAPGAIKVALYFDGVLLRRDGSVPFCLDDNMDRKYQPIVDVRSHTVTAQALDGKDRALGPPYMVVFDVAPVPIISLSVMKTTDPVPAIEKLSNSTVVDRATMGFQLTVCADAPGAERMNFYLDGSLVRRDDSVPFCIQDNYNSAYTPLAAVGSRTVTAQALDSSNLIIGPTYTVTYTVLPVPITELSLIRSKEPLPPIGSLLSMSTVNIAEVGTELTVCAIAEGAVKVAFYFDGVLAKRDNSYPFCLDDNIDRKYAPLIVVKNHNLTAVALDGADNVIGPPRTCIFDVVNEGSPSSSTGEVSSIQLINTKRNFPVAGILTNSSVINLIESGTELTICANADGATSVTFFLDDKLVRSDGSKPFCFADNYGKKNDNIPIPGEHKVVAYAMNSSGYVIGLPYVVTFYVDPIPVSKLVLMDVSKPLPEIEILSNSSVVSRQNHGLSLTICAEAPGAIKVALYFDGVLLRRDGSVPFCLDDNMDRKYQPIVDVRPHTVTAQALDGNDRALGPPYTVVFDVAPVPIISLSLIKTTDPVPSIEKLSNSTVLDRATMGFQLTICADAPGAERVNFYLDGSLVRRDDSVPFCIQDNYNSAYTPLAAVGSRTVTAQALDSSNLIIGPTYTVTYTVLPVQIVELSLMKVTEPLPPIGSMWSISTVNVAEVGTELTVCAATEGAVKVAFYFDGSLVRRDGSLPFCMDDHMNSKYNGLSVVGSHSISVQALDGSDNPLGPRMDVYFNVVNGARKERRTVVETNAAVAASGSLSSTIGRGIQQSRFRGTSGEISFDQVPGMERDYQGMTVGLYNIHPRPVNVTSGKRSFWTVLISKYTQSSGWQDLPGAVQINRDGTRYEENIFRRFFDYHYLTPGVRIVGLILMGIAWLFSLVLFGLATWLRNVPELQQVPPFCFQWLCLGSMILSSAIFTLSWDENAGWTDTQLNILCTLTPWLFFIGQILHFGTF
jgi:hypothetical protein